MSFNAGTAYLNIIPRTDQFAAGLSGGIKRALAQSEGALAKSGAVMKTVGSSLTKYVTLPLAAAGAGAVSMALKFDDAFTRIAALSNVTTKQLGEMRAGVLRLAGQTAKSPQELAEALYFLASAGLRANQIMPALAASAKASAAGLGTTADIAKITAQAMNVYAKSGLTATRVTDTLVAAVKAGTADPAEFAGALGRILPIAAKAKVSFGEVTASLASLSNVGLDVNEGVTAMRGVLLALEAPGTQAAKTLKSVGISTDEMRAAIADKGLLGALRLLDTATGGNIDTMRKIIPNVRALTGDFGLLGQKGSQVDGVFEQVTHSQGALGKAFATTQEGPMFKFRQGLAHLQVSAIQLGEKLLPVVLKIIDFISRMANRFNHLSPAMQSTIIKFGAIALVAGPVLRIFGGLVGTTAKLGGALRGLIAPGSKAVTAISGLATASGSAATAEGAVGAAAAGAAPVLVAVAAAAAAAGAVFVAWKLRGLDPANIAMQEAAVNSVGVVTGVDGQKHAVSGVIKTWQQYHAIQAKNNLANNTLVDGLHLSGHALRLFNGLMVNATGVSGKQARSIAVLISNLQHYHGSLTDLQKAQLQHALFTGNMTAATKVLNTAIDHQKGIIERNAKATRGMSDDMQNVGPPALVASTGVHKVGAAALEAAGRVADAARKAELLALKLSKIRDKTVDVTVLYHQIGGAGIRGLFQIGEGGVFRAAGGALFPGYGDGQMFMGPGRTGPFVAGEASYPTPLGTGAEIVSPKGVEPLANDHLDRIGDYILGRMRGASGSGHGAQAPMVVNITESANPQRTLAELRYERSIRGW